MQVTYAFLEPFSAMLRVIPVVMGALCIAAVVLLPILLISALLKRGRRGGEEHAADESRMIQELYHGLARLEDRVESLETILLAREQQGDRR